MCLKHKNGTVNQKKRKENRHKNGSLRIIPLWLSPYVFVGVCATSRNRRV